MQLLQAKSFIFITAMLVMLFMGCTLQQHNCIKIFDNETTIELGDCEIQGTTVLFFNIESDLVFDRYDYREPQYFYVDYSSLETLKGYLSEQELLKLKAFKRIRQMGPSYRIMLPSFVPQSRYRKEIVPAIFFLSEDQETLCMKNPFNGKDIDITDVDYIKFTDTYLIPVPPL